MSSPRRRVVVDVEGRSDGTTESYTNPLLCLGSELSSICLRTEFGGSGTGLREEARENWLNEGTEDDLGTAGLRERHPKDENELEGVVEGEPVHSIDHAFNDGQECVDDPISQPLGIIGLAGTEQSFQGVVSRNYEAGKVGEKCACDVEEDEEEVEGEEAQDDVDFRYACLLLKIVEHGVLAQFFIERANVMVGFVLKARHDGFMLRKSGVMNSLSVEC